MQSFMLLSSSALCLSLCLFVFFWIGHYDVSAQIIGSQVSCNVEGESVIVTDVPMLKCYSCNCLNETVKCSKQKCINDEGCYMLQEVPEDECCKKCKGCEVNNTYYESGAEWTDSSDPCKLFTCIAGVITESQIQCHVTCNNSIPQEPGKCCPTCNDCQFEGKNVIQKTGITSEKDPCIFCECDLGGLKCIKKTCPVLNCPKSKILQTVGECCPRCQGSDTYSDSISKNACVLDATKYDSGIRFMLDACTKCICENSTIYCERKNCPILECKKDSQKIIPGQCCAQCIQIKKLDKVDRPVTKSDSKELLDKIRRHKTKIERNCLHEGQAYKNRETWNTSTCESCTCMHGRVKCGARMCPVITCPPNSTLKIPHGECCPVCQDTQGVCTIFGGSHFRTLDGKLYAFLGSCKYILASDCYTESFSIALRTIVSGNDAIIKELTFELEGVQVNLEQYKDPRVNDEIIDLPYQLSKTLEIDATKQSVTIVADIGVKINWNYSGFLEVTVPKRYRKRLCGLCGDFNSVADDDLITREGISVDDPAIFAQSWIYGDEECFQTRKYGARGCNPRRDKRLCNYIRGSVFEKCLRKINVSFHYDTCLRDMCECLPNDLQCHCESFASYVNDCQKLGIFLPGWQKSVGC